MDCSAEPVIGIRATRWLGMTKKGWIIDPAFLQPSMF
jgi:hypothetical protein